MLDDVHLLRNPACGAILRAVCDGTPAGSQVVLLSRSEAPDWLAPARAEDRLDEITSRDLRFDASEAARAVPRRGCARRARRRGGHRRPDRGLGGRPLPHRARHAPQHQRVPSPPGGPHPGLRPVHRQLHQHRGPAPPRPRASGVRRPHLDPRRAVPGTVRRRAGSPGLTGTPCAAAGRGAADGPARPRRAPGALPPPPRRGAAAGARSPGAGGDPGAARSRLPVVRRQRSSRRRDPTREARRRPVRGRAPRLVGLRGGDRVGRRGPVGQLAGRPP